MNKNTLSLLEGYIKKAKDKLSAAEILLKNNEYDDAVSRAYYCAFHAAQALLLTEGIEAGAHHGVVTLFGLHFVNTEKFDKKFGKMLNNLKDDRENGDYDVFSVIEEEDAAQALDEARQFLKGAEEYLKKYLKK